MTFAFQLSQGKAKGVAAGAVVTKLAGVVLRTGPLAKIKVAIVPFFLMAVVTGAAAWTPRPENPEPPIAQNDLAIPAEIMPPEVAVAPPQPIVESTERTVRGIVRDEQGRPVAKAWVGHVIQSLPDAWKLIRPASRLRETKVPYRDATGKIVAAGALGKYLELRDDEGNWKPVHPAEIRRYEPDQNDLPARPPGLPAVAKQSLGKDLFEIRVATDRWKIEGNGTRRYNRTDSEGRFECVASFSPEYPRTEIHFASPDYSRQAIHVVHIEDPEQPLEIVLRPVRRVRARVVETPEDQARGEIGAYVWATNVSGVSTYYADEIAGTGVPWGSPTFLDAAGSGVADDRSWLETLLIPGRYRIRFNSETVERLVDIEVPAGVGTLVLPDIRLDTLAWVRMVGKPAAEISAADLQGRSVKLADYRGKLVVLDFWESPDQEWVAGVRRMVRMQKRFKDHPIEFLAIHDASITAPAVYREVIASITKQAGVDALPFRMLLDRPPVGKGTGPYPARAGERYSGQTSDRYEIVRWPSTFVIDKGGRVVFAVMVRSSGPEAASYQAARDGKLLSQIEDEAAVGKDFQLLDRSGMDALEGTLEELLGLPRSHRTTPEVSRMPVPDPFEPEQPREPQTSKPRKPITVKGWVCDLDGVPIEGARVLSSADSRAVAHEAKTGPKGRFSVSVGMERFAGLTLKVEAARFATRVFTAHWALDFLNLPDDDLTFDANGELSQPLFLGEGVTVAGRVVRDGKPVASIKMRLNFVDSGPADLLGTPETKTDLQGVFRFEHVLPDTHFAVYAERGSVRRAGTIAPRPFQTGEDGTSVDLGELQVEPGKTLAGRVVFSDSKTPYKKAELSVSPKYAGSAVDTTLDEKGCFRVEGLPRAPISIRFSFDGNKTWDRFPDGYRLSPQNKCSDPTFLTSLTGRLDRDIRDLTILVEPDEEPNSGQSYLEVGSAVVHRWLDADPTAVADFEDAADGPITGVPPQSLKQK